jgi:hypothetical protein
VNFAQIGPSSDFDPVRPEPYLARNLLLSLQETICRPRRRCVEQESPVQVTSSLSSLLGKPSSSDVQSAANLLIKKTSDTAASSSSSQTGDTDTDSSSTESTAVKDFLDYMKKPPAQRMTDAWLKAHNLTEDDLKKMPTAQRDAIEKQMASDIKADMQKKMQATTGQPSSAASLTTLLNNSI